MKIIPTADGSVTILNEELAETYHSVHGAIQEAKHVFINNGIDAISGTEINLLEVGLGTGLNLLLTYQYVQKRGIKVNFTGIEPHLLPLNLVESLNYPALLEEEGLNTILLKIHTAPADQITDLSPLITLNKVNKGLLNWKSKEKFDLIYFDAFGPRAQPEMWLPEVFEKMYEVLIPEGILVTYCAKGEVKRILKRIGFMIESLPGPPGKREMTRARKI